MIREVRTAEQLGELIQAGEGFLYNDFGGRDPKMCPIHAMRCRWIPTMLKPGTERLSVPKLWSASLDELIAEVEVRGKVYAFCGSEPTLKRYASPTITRAESIIEADVAREAIRASGGHSDNPVALSSPRVEIAPGIVTVTCAHRLQYDSKPQTVQLKSTIGTAVTSLSAGPDQILEAVFISASSDSFDAENVLLYNVGTGRFAESATNGLRFERVFAEPPGGCDGWHQHIYRLIPAHSISSNWRRLAPVVAASGLRLPRLDAFSKPDAVWLATRLAVPAGANPHTHAYSLDLTLTVGDLDSVRPADIVKPLIDGVVAGLHCHNGRDNDIVVRRLAGRLRLPEATMSAHLSDASRAWLGARRLLWPRADGLQWNPGDDDCVSATLHMARGASREWELSFEVHRVEPIGSRE